MHFYKSCWNFDSSSQRTAWIQVTAFSGIDNKQVPEPMYTPYTDKYVHYQTLICWSGALQIGNIEF